MMSITAYRPLLVELHQLDQLWPVTAHGDMTGRATKRCLFFLGHRKCKSWHSIRRQSRQRASYPAPDLRHVNDVISSFISPPLNAYLMGDSFIRYRDSPYEIIQTQIGTKYMHLVRAKTLTNTLRLLFDLWKHAEAVKQMASCLMLALHFCLVDLSWTFSGSGAVCLVLIFSFCSS